MKLYVCVRIFLANVKGQGKEVKDLKDVVELFRVVIDELFGKNFSLQDRVAELEEALAAEKRHNELLDPEVS